MPREYAHRMTLITFAVTSEYVVLASDRRLTVSDGRGRIIDQSDRATKSTMLWGQMLMGYTGLAILDGRPMEMWAADALIDVAPNDAPAVLADKMNHYYATHREVQGVPHHFRIAGFGFNPDRKVSTWPLGVEIGNSRQELNGDRVALSTVGDFEVTYNGVGNRRVIVGAVGSPFSKRRLNELRQSVKFGVRADHTNPARVFDAIVKFTRETAQTSRGTVGEVVTVSSIPRTAVPVREMGWTIPLSPEGVTAARTGPFTCTYYPGGAAEQHQWMPAIIHKGMAMAGGVMAQGESAPTPPDFPPVLGQPRADT